MSGLPMPSADRVETVFPSASPLSVATPSLMRARYFLSEASRYCENFVASPKTEGQDAGSQRVEAAGVPYLARAEQPLCLLHGIVRTHAARLVDNHDSVNDTTPSATHVRVRSCRPRVHR